MWLSDCKMTPCFISLWFSPSYNVTLQPLHGRSGICLPTLGIWVGLGTCSGQQDVVEVTVSSSKPTIQGALRAPVSLIPPQPQAWLAGWRTRHRQKSVVRAPLLTAHTREPSWDLLCLAQTAELPGWPQTSEPRTDVHYCTFLGASGWLSCSSICGHQ